MAKSKRVKVLKYSPVYDTQDVEIGHVVEDQVLLVDLSGDSQLIPVVDPCPWGAFGIQALIPRDVVEVIVDEEKRASSSRRSFVEPASDVMVVDNAIPPEPEG